ncbi:MAG: choice-of-anchor L domain-containing protein, partial [Bacteroidota bacterium]
YDGFTTVLTATFEVIPCQTYHIRLIIGDVGDAQLDSAVFLEAESFDIGPKVAIKYVPNIAEAGITMVEGCADGTILFERTDEIDFDRDLVVDYVINPGTTASEGQDFPPLTKQIVIPAMETSVRVPITALQDQQLEEIEKLVLDLDIPCYCQPKDNALLFIKDKEPLIVIPDTVVSCPEETILLLPSVIAGSEPFRYQWSNGTDENTLFVNAVQSNETYALTVSDLCGEEASAEMQVDFFDPPQASLGGIYDWCPGQPVNIPVELLGQGPFQLEYQLGSERFSVDSIMSTPYSLEVNRPGDLEITRVVDQNCEGNVEGGVTIQSVGPVVRSNLIPLLCPDARDAIIELFIEHNQDYRVVWDTLVNDVNRPSGLGPGNYRYTVIDEQGCQFSEEISILRPSIEEILRNGCSTSQILDNLYIPTAFSPNNDGRND